MKILLIGSDRQLFIEGTEARRRMESYCVLAEEIHVIVFSKRSFGFKETVLTGNIILYPTNSLTKIGYIFDALRIGKRIKDITLVSAQDPFECSLAGISLARYHKARLQIQMHIDAFNMYFRKEEVLNRVRSFIARFTLPQADCIRVVSERIKVSVLNQSLKLRCVPIVLPVYVDVSYFETSEPKISLREKYQTFTPLVLMACRLVPQKDIPTALRAFALLIQKEPRAGLVIVGEGYERDHLQNLVYSLRLQDHVIFELWQKDMVSYLKTADIFLMTSTHEGYQRSLGEAAASGITVVTTEIGPVGSIYKNGDSVLSCPVGDVDCIAEKLLLVSRDVSLREKMVARARDVAKNAIAKDYETYLEMYRNIFTTCV